MAPSTFVLLLATLLLVSLAAPSDVSTSFDLHAKLNHPYAGSLLSTHEMVRDATRASKARRRAWNAAMVAAKPSNYSTIVPIRPFSSLDHTLTISIGTPPQPRTLILDTGSDLIWTQCKPFDAREHREPPYDPSKSSSFAAVPCDGRLCETGSFNSKNCSRNRCIYTYNYGSATTKGELASDTFTFGEHRRVSVSLDFGCGKLTDGSIPGASGILGVSPDKLSLISQLQIPRFSYCLTPFGDRNASHIFFGAMADLSKYKTTGPIQTTSLVSNPDGTNYYYYVPLIGISVGTKRLDVPESSFAIAPDGSGGTFVDSGDTDGLLPSVAMEALIEALMETVKLPVVNDTDYELCFQLPNGIADQPEETVQVPPLVYHFDGGATMVLPRESFMAEVSAGTMCLVITSGGRGAIIGNYQQQNMHVLFDVQNHKFSFAPTQCNQI